MVENAIDPATLTTLNSVIQAFQDQSRTGTASDSVFDVAPCHSHAHLKLRRLKDPVNRQPAPEAIVQMDQRPVVH